MDVEDVSGIQQWMELLQKQKVALENANKRKGQQPRDRKSLDQLIDRQMASYASISMMKIQNEHSIYHSFVAAPYLPSIAPFDSLKKIFLKDLKLQTHHLDTYILLRVATPAFSMTAVMAILEDEMGDGVMLQLYQQADQPDRRAEDAVKLKSVCIVKEPYFKIMSDGGYGVRVDHVSDIVWLSTEDDRIPLRWRPKLSEIKEANVLKKDGNAAIKKGKARIAAELYTAALTLTTTDEESQVVKLNRSLAHLKLGLYDKALEDAGELSNDVHRSEKGLYRAACAMSGLRRFEKCHETLKVLLAHYPDCESAKTMLARTQCLLKEQEYGEYDYSAMYKAAQDAPPCLDNATYIGPVEIRESDGRGRGLFTTKDLAAGALILCEKAFAFCFAANEAKQESANVSTRTTLLLNVETKRAYIGTQADLITFIVRKLHDNPSLMPVYNSLYHGDYVPVKRTNVDGIPIIDTFLVERIMSLNVFGCPRTSLKMHFDNSQNKERPAGHHTSGIFVTASHVNHSCHCNARRSFIGDMQIVRAARDIPAGTEITFWYSIPESTDTYDKTQKRLENWGFKCTCITCEANKKVKKAIVDKRLKLRSDLLSALDAKKGMDAAKFERTLGAIESTYTMPATAVPRLVLWDPLLFLTRTYSLENKPAHAITYAWKTLASLGFVIKRDQPTSLTSPFEVAQWGQVVDHVIETWVQLWVAYAKLAPSLCSKCEDYARVTYKICIGEDETFDENYGRVARRAMGDGARLVAELEKIGL